VTEKEKTKENNVEVISLLEAVIILRIIKKKENPSF
jgi:hypothetical protein